LDHSFTAGESAMETTILKLSGPLDDFDDVWISE